MIVIQGDYGTALIFLLYCGDHADCGRPFLEISVGWFVNSTDRLFLGLEFSFGRNAS